MVKARQRMMMALLVASSVGLLAAPAYAQSGADDVDRVVHLDAEFTDFETGRRYDCRYAVGEAAQRSCVEMAAKQERFGFTVKLGERVLSFGDRDPWGALGRELQRMDRNEAREMQRRWKYERQEWQREREQEQAREQVRMGAAPKDRAPEARTGAAERRNGSKDRNERGRSAGGRNSNRGER